MITINIDFIQKKVQGFKCLLQDVCLIFGREFPMGSMGQLIKLLEWCRWKCKYKGRKRVLHIISLKGL